MPKQWVYLLSLIVVLVSMMLVMWLGPVIETRFFPVYSRFTVETANEVEGGTEVQFRFTKYRECPARGWAWFIGDFGAVSRQVEARPTENAVIRPLGEAVSNTHFIAATPDDIRHSMFAEIYSRCHIFWLTRTVVYP